MATSPETPVGRDPLTRDDVVAVARSGIRAHLTDETRTALAQGRERVLDLVLEPEPAYGVNTGLGALAGWYIGPSSVAGYSVPWFVQRAAGSDTEVEREVVRAMMVLWLWILASGRSGVQTRTADIMVGMRNAGITPVVSEHESLG